MSNPVTHASSSTSTTGGITDGQRRVRTPKIPSRCWCGESIIELISKSGPNPYRQYYRCLFAYKRRLENDDHVFKWVDEAFTYEIQQLDNQVRILEEEVQLLKATIRSEVVSILTYEIVSVHVVHVRDFMDVFEVQPIVQRIDDVDLRMACSI
ncbi:hypothetical protein BRARA_I02737 [Brassica rapa]|uniref:GRF-type domain-containing protein n=1 Tax=Brassica campestris TaxID=3711 RepID=A0A397Y5B5_BRACM|nr:hypothetical protein BRARA_I02737 [Brassica rapa]